MFLFYVPLGINHQSPLIYWLCGKPIDLAAGNQSPIPFDILAAIVRSLLRSWESITNPL